MSVVHAQGPANVTPPIAVQRVDAAYPIDALRERREARVELFVTVAADGSVAQVEVASSAGESFDASAIAAVKRWRFEPARRGEVAIVSRIRVPVAFTLPAAEPPPPPAAAQRSAPPPSTLQPTSTGGGAAEAQTPPRGRRGATDARARTSTSGAANDAQTQTASGTGATDVPTRSATSAGANDARTQPSSGTGATDAPTRSATSGGANDAQTRTSSRTGATDAPTRSATSPTGATDAPTRSATSGSGATDASARTPGTRQTPGGGNRASDDQARFSRGGSGVADAQTSPGGGSGVAGAQTSPGGGSSAADAQTSPGGGSSVADAQTSPSGESGATGEMLATSGDVGLGDAELGAEGVIDVTVYGHRDPRAEPRSASDFELDRELISAAPRSEGAEVLRAAPGVYIGRGEGPAVAHNYMLRGFDAEHGQDIAFRVGGLPINQPSHIHGQGYADLGFLIGDVVDSLRVTEGVSDPRQGDFAVAGSIDIDLAAAERGVRLRSSYGSFNTFRQLLMWAPPDAENESFGAVQYMRTDGFGQQRAAQSGSGIFQLRAGSGELRYRAIGVVHAARSDLAGVLRQADIDRGSVCYACSYEYPTAQKQNALADRVLLGLFADYSPASGASGRWGAFIGYDNFRLQENFTGFLQRSRTLEQTSGRGDLIEQQNRTLTFGLTGHYRTAPLRPAPWTHGTLELGLDARVDSIDQAQNLLDASVRSQTWDRRVDASIRSADLGAYADLDWRFGTFLRARIGMRGDVLSFDVDDRLGNFAPLSRPQDTYIVGFRRSALGLAVGPRSSLELQATPWLSVLAAYGQGYRSPQARLLEDGEDTPFSKVHSADLGLRIKAGAPLQLTVAGYYTRLSDDVAFDAAEGRLERIGATQRLGAVAHLITRPLPWLVGSLSFTFVHATLLEPPPATAEEPQPPFRAGQSLPFVPPVVVRADVSARRTLVASVVGRLGLGFSYLSSRPLPYGDSAAPVSLLDATAALEWSAITLSMDVFNALGSRYAAVEYSFPSDWDPNDGVRPRTPARHIAAGSPFACMFSLGVKL
ncbi:MAG TPA: TonB-dependent receptor [Polyangiales bacterium]|nr:TonB-dependent receptor [Polyangiales bacterium]